MEDRTKTGLVLLIISIILGPIPILQYLGGVVGVIGAILAILGRHPFGDAHSRNILWSMGLYIIGLIIIISFTLGFTTEILSLAGSSSLSRAVGEAIISSFNNFLIGIVAGSALIGLSYVLFTHALQGATGRLMLWTAFGIDLTIEVVLLSYFGFETSRIVHDVVSVGSSDLGALESLQSRIQLAGLLGLIPAAIYAVAYYMAYDHINWG